MKDWMDIIVFKLLPILMGICLVEAVIIIGVLIVKEVFK